MSAVIGAIETSTKFQFTKWRSRPFGGGRKGVLRIFLENFHNFPTLTPACEVGVGNPNFVDRKCCGRFDFAEESHCVFFCFVNNHGFCRGFRLEQFSEQASAENEGNNSGDRDHEKTQSRGLRIRIHEESVLQKHGLNIAN